MKKILFLVILLFPLIAFSQTRQDSVGVKTISSLTELTANIDTSQEVILHDPATGKILYRASIGEFLKTIASVSSVVGTSQIVNATIINEDISGSAAIALSKLQNLTANRLVGRDTTGTGIPESLTVGYGLRMGTDRIDIDTVSATGIVSKSRLTNALDDVVASGGGIWEQENSTTLATVNTTDNYHEGEIGIGDFSSNLIAAPIHVYATDARIRLSDSTSTDTTAMAYLEYFRGYNSTNMGRVGYLSNTDIDLTIENSLSGGSVNIETEGTVKVEVLPSGQLDLKSYGDTLFTGTAVKYLAVTDAGLVIEADASGGGASISAGTPTNSDSPASAAGSLLYNDTSLYVKTSAGWAYTALTLLPSPFALSYSTDLLLYVYQGAEANVSNWGDQSTSGNDITQGTATNQPAIDGSGAPDFDGVDNYMIVPNLWSAVNDSSYTAFIVFDFDASTASQRVIAYSNDAGNNSWALQINNVDATNYSTQFFTFDSGGLLNLTNLDTAAINTNVLVTIAASENSSIQVRQNAVQVGTSAVTGPWNYTGVTTGFNIGVNANADVGFMDGQIRLIAIYKRKLTPAEISTVEGEINTALSIY